MRRKHLYLLACLCAMTGTGALAQAQSSRNVSEIAQEDEGCRCGSCSPGSRDCVYIVCSDPNQSGMCYGVYHAE
jgi:hypothetical protein